MLRVPRVAVVLLLLVLLCLPGVAIAVEAPTPPADGEQARVVHVTDGDTIRVELERGGTERVRYIGIDTPEISHSSDEADEPWGPEATELNEQLVDDRIVLLERDVSDTDHYDRLLRYVWVETSDGWVMVNGALVANGLADVRAYEPDTRHDEYLRWVEEEARAAGTGMHQPGSGTWNPGSCDVAGYVVEGCLGEPEDKGLLERFLDFIARD